MFVLSGVLLVHSFPEVTRPFISALPLTAMCDGLRAVMIDGVGLAGTLPYLAVLAGGRSIVPARLPLVSLGLKRRTAAWQTQSILTCSSELMTQLRLAQLARVLSPSAVAPYFAHMRLETDGRIRDILLGPDTKTGGSWPSSTGEMRPG